ncbi:unnamed protein product [Closterium sp. Naga37s-1]|nr:unnamed protein product [Closterium sp. Naga37s-1]
MSVRCSVCAGGAAYECVLRLIRVTRFLLRYTALELSFTSPAARPPALFTFASPRLAADFAAKLAAVANATARSTRAREEHVMVVDRPRALERAEKAAAAWRRRELSNFEYLMVLNTLAGRTYNDLAQYPVFPWVIADYESEHLDLGSESTFRDLGKPVGALNAKRLEFSSARLGCGIRTYNDLAQYPVFPWVIADYESQHLDLHSESTFRDLGKPVGALNAKRLEMFRDRAESFRDPDIPSFLYGSHYSTAGIVLFYLLRLEPFATLSCRLQLSTTTSLTLLPHPPRPLPLPLTHSQGGKFDHADRLFQSVAVTWANCLTNTSDVKELTPEFFYLPDFLSNANHLYLGQCQDGSMLNDVVLPPWAQVGHMG